MSSINVPETLLSLYPEARDCALAGQHVGAPIESYFWEMDDDRAYLMKTKRCSHCHIPVDGDDYCTLEETDAWYEHHNNTRTTLAR